MLHLGAEHQGPMAHQWLQRCRGPPTATQAHPGHPWQGLPPPTHTCTAHPPQGSVYAYGSGGWLLRGDVSVADGAVSARVTADAEADAATLLVARLAAEGPRPASAAATAPSTMGEEGISEPEAELADMSPDLGGM